ncbi:ChaN family lipoprotein [Geomonas sp.]|uniref:ChaN family lipoprotein n=1 Tax=Geomonas sp. TaxID=2651584 RepID=UPI002B4AACFB|nr:ChaN family lipoprotein [Geomonas sp.]HJV34795.1 ChaN family lipoprotein [Geomonas sp.]
MGDPQEPYPRSTPPKVGEIVHLPTGFLVSKTQMLDIAADARVVYVGETHDNPASHRVELEVLQGLEQRHPGRVALGMEMFHRAQQPVLDRWSAGELDEKSFVKAVKWFDDWKMDFDYYRDILLFARDKHIPILGLNANKDLVKAVRSKPAEELSAEEKAQLPEMDMSDIYQRGTTEGLFEGHSHGKMQVEAFLRVQTLWDETMAETAARYLLSPAGKGKHLMVMAGGNHIKYGFGIPRRVFRRIPTSYVLIGGTEIAVAEGTKPEYMDEAELPQIPMRPYDFLNYLSYESLPKRAVMLGVMYEPTASGKGLEVSSVVPGSNAERAGVKAKDVLIGLDNEPLIDSYDLAYAIKKKKAGDHSTLELLRDGKPLKLEVTFLPTVPEQKPEKK